MNSNIWAKAGAIVYVLWGVLHLKAAQMAYAMAQMQEAGPVQGRLEQNAWNLLFFAVAGIVIAVWMNWRNSKTGYWLNAIMVSAGDIGFIVFVLLPGYAPMMPGALGPILWIVALSLTTVGYIKAE
jgi:magnesium-transporting ATPase (P-type)